MQKNWSMFSMELFCPLSKRFEYFVGELPLIEISRLERPFSFVFFSLFLSIILSANGRWWFSTSEFFSFFLFSIKNNASCFLEFSVCPVLLAIPAIGGVPKELLRFETVTNWDYRIKTKKRKRTESIIQEKL